MMNGKHLFSAVVAAGLVGFVSFAAVGDVTTNEITGVTEITANTTYGASTTLIGDGSFKVLNGKTLTLNGTNSFTGGVVVENGYLITLNSLNSTVNFAGTGDITLNCDGTKPCRWTYSSSICNNLIITGNSTKEYVATTQGGGSNLRGTVKAYGDYYVGVTGYDGRGDSYDSAKVSYANTVDVTDHTLAMSGHTMVQFNAKVLCDTLYGYYRTVSHVSALNGVKGGIYLAAANNDIKHVVLDHQKLWLQLGGAIDGATIRFEGQHFPMTNMWWQVDTKDSSKSKWVYAETGYLNVNYGKVSNAKQSFKWIESDECPRTEGVGYDIRSSYTGGFTTLELTGEADKTADACVAISNAINLVIAESAPSSFRQIFRNRRSMMTGTIAVNGGALEVAGEASFENVPSVTVAAGRELALKSSNAAFAGATAVTIGAGGKLVVDGANPFGGDTDLYICSDTIVDLATDVTVKRLFVDGVQRPSGTITDTYYFAKRGTGTLTVTEGEVVPTLEVYVPENEVQTNVAGLAEGTLLVKFGAGTLVLTEESDRTGGLEIRDGVVFADGHQTLGTGEILVYGATDRLVQLRVRCASGQEHAFPNDITFKSASSREFPALFCDGYAYFTGDIVSECDVYFATAWANDVSKANEVGVKFMGTIIVADGCRLAAAPHCQVAFSCSVFSVPILEGFWTPGAAANGGNAGSLRLDKGGNADLGRVVIDQTRVICNAVNCTTNAIIEWTGEHAQNGYGYFDLKGMTSWVRGFATGAGCTNATEGLQITNSASSTCSLNVGDNGNKTCGATGDWYFQICERITWNWKVTSPLPAPVFRNRRHAITSLGHATYFTIGEGASFPFVTSSSGSSGATMTVNSEEPDALASLKSVTQTSSKIQINTKPAADSVNRGHRLSITSNRSSGGTDYGFAVPSDYTLNIAAAKVHPRSNGSALVNVPCGEYTQADYFEFVRGTFRCWAARTAWTNIVWSGEADADLGDAANWTNTDDGEASAATFGLPLNKATITGGSSATVNGLVNFGKLTVAGGFTVGGTGIVAFYDDGLQVGQPNANGGSTVTFNVPVDFQTNKLVVAAGDTVVFAAGFTNEVWEKAADTFTVSEGSAGRVELGGAVPTTLTVKGGTLGFVAGAALPANDTLVLDIADGAKIEVANGDILRVKSLKYRGAAVPVGYFTECVTGGGTIRVAESTAPAVIETLTWDHEGEGGLMSERTNWEGSPYFELSFADKYDFVFAKSGSEAVLDEPVTMHSLIFRNGPFAIRRGNDDAVIKLGTVDYVGTVGEAGVPHEYVVEPPLELVKNTMFSVAPDDTLVLNHLLGTATLTTSNGGSFVMKDMPEFTGGMSLKNAKVFFTGTIGSEATAEGVEYLWRHKDDAGGITTRCKITLSNAVFNAWINMSTPGATGSEDTQWMDVAEGTTNVFNRLVNPTATVTIRNRKDAWLIFEKGAQFAATAIFSSITGTKANPAVYDFKEKVTATSEAKGSLGLSGSYGLYIFEQVGNYAIRGMSLSAAFVDCRQPNQFQLENSTKRTGIVSSTTNSRLYLNNNREEFACLLMGAVTGGGPIIRGDYPATLAVVGGAITNSGSPSATIISDNNLQKVLFEGWVGVDVDVADDLGLKLIGTKSMSHGDLSVKSGELSLDAETLWPYGTNFTARGTGTLKFAAAGQINGDFAQLHVADNGKVYIPEGVMLRVSAATHDGQPVNAGTYETDGATGISAHLTGGGRLRVGKAGMMFIVK